MTNLREIVQKSLASVNKVMVMQKKLSRRLDIKSTVAERIKSILEIVLDLCSLR